MVKKRIIRETGTFARHIQNGYCRTVDGQAWQYMLLPSQPSVRDASGLEERIKAAKPLLDILTRLADLVPDIPFANRKMAKGFYRRIHILAISGSRKYEPSPILPPDARTRLAAAYSDLIVHDRFTLFGVQLNTGTGQGIKGFLQSIADEDGWVADSAYEHDRQTILNILTTAGCTIPDDMIMQRGFAWWPTDTQADALPVMVENDHLHTFPSYATAFMAARYREQVTDCTAWAGKLKGSYPITMCTLGVLPFRGADNTSPGSDWASTLLAASQGGGGGAVAISVKGLVEPGRMSREQIDKDTDKVLEKAYEQANAGRKANLSIAQELKYANDTYQLDGKPWPTLIEGRVHVAIPRIIEQTTSIPYPGRLSLDSRRQDSAFMDMQIGSDGLVEYNPSPVYWPAPILAYSGLNGRSVVGDDMGLQRASDLAGALVGVTEADRIAAYDSPYAASARSGKPLTLVIGSTGSGKRLSLNTLLPVPPQPKYPNGSIIPLKNLQVGDLLYARDGKPYPILGMSLIESADMYRITFSDGQTVTACGEHQWCVWSWKDRNYDQHGKHAASVDREQCIRRTTFRLRTLAATLPASEWWEPDRIWERVQPIVGKLASKGGASWIYNALHFTDTPNMTRIVRVPTSRLRTVCDTLPLIAWLKTGWRNGQGIQLTNKREWTAELDLMIGEHLPARIGVYELEQRLGPLGMVHNACKEAIRTYPGLKYQEPGYANTPHIMYPARQAIMDLADRLEWRYRAGGSIDRQRNAHGEQVLTTRDMISEGLTESGGQDKWAIRVPAACEGHHMDLPLDPWILGAWLADGAAISGCFASDPSNGDLDYAINHFEQSGFHCTRGKTSTKDIYIRGLVPVLTRMGLKGNKHIPEPYFHASIEQRLELVRGLLDQDGTIDGNGTIEFTQIVSHRPIVEGLVRLLRGLGIKVHEPTQSKAGYTIDRTRHQTQDRLRVTFTTDLPVFGLPRKLMKLPRTLRKTQQWLYIKDISPVENCPSRCLSIASPDHTYLIEGYIPTHNTRLGLHLAAQWGWLTDPKTVPNKQTMIENGQHVASVTKRIPVVFWDPKPNSSDFEPYVTRMRGNIYKLDQPEAKGILDPFRCIPSHMKDMIVQMSVSMLSQITGGANPDRAWEMGITSIIGYGLRHQANGIGDAVNMAYQEYVTGGVEANTISPLVERIKPDLDRAVLNDPLMPLIYASGSDGARLNASEGLTLISAGSLNVITEKEIQGAPTDVQRWVCRMAAIAASCLVIGRSGVVIIDEAWSLLQDRYGRSVVNRMGRIARDQHYMVMLLSQKADEFVDSGVENFVGKTYVLAVGARNEGNGRDSQAQAACRLANQPLDGRMHARMMHDKWLDPESKAPDWESLYPLKEPTTGKLLRGAIAYLQVGDAASAIPVEVRIDPTLE